MCRASGDLLYASVFGLRSCSHRVDCRAEHFTEIGLYRYDVVWNNKTILLSNGLIVFVRNEKTKKCIPFIN